MDESGFSITSGRPSDVPLILEMIRELAEYERLSHLVACTEDMLREALFGARPMAEVILGRVYANPAAYALYFYTFSTFLGRRGLYLEDIFVRPAYRRRGYARALLIHLGRLAKEKGCARFEWRVLDWNEAAIRFYEELGATVLPDWRVVRVTGAALDQLADLASEEARDRPISTRAT
jgi:GNAT superfamily N-acetyltransferase